jgi:hypothetical protein
MQDLMVFCSLQPLPNDEFTKEMMMSIAAPGMRRMGSYHLKSKSDWKNLPDDEKIAEIVLVGADDPAEYEVPAEGMVEIHTRVGDQYRPCQFQVIELGPGRKGVLAVPTAARSKLLEMAEEALAGNVAGAVVVHPTKQECCARAERSEPIGECTCGVMCMCTCCGCDLN